MAENDIPEGEPTFDKNKAAVAIKYERGTDPAPKLVAKGKGSVAEQMIAIALDNDIEIKEDADLVEILQKLDVDALIPLEAYAAVAEILAFVYRANNRAKENFMRRKAEL